MNDNKPDKPVWLMRDKATMATIQGLRRQGITTAADIARALNERGVLPPKGNRWHATLVQRIITHGTAPSSPSLSETIQSPAIGCDKGEVFGKISGTVYMRDEMPEKSAAQGYRPSCEAAIRKDSDGFSMTLTTRGGGQTQFMVEKTVESYHEAEYSSAGVRITSHHGFPWHKVEVVCR